MNRYFRFLSLSFLCVTLLACSGKDDETTKADAGDGAAAVDDPGAGGQAAAVIADESATSKTKVDDLFGGEEPVVNEKTKTSATDDLFDTTVTAKEEETKPVAEVASAPEDAASHKEDASDPLDDLLGDVKSDDAAQPTPEPAQDESAAPAIDNVIAAEPAEPAKTDVEPITDDLIDAGKEPVADAGIGDELDDLKGDSTADAGDTAIDVATTEAAPVPGVAAESPDKPLNDPAVDSSPKTPAAEIDPLLSNVTPGPVNAGIAPTNGGTATPQDTANEFLGDVKSGNVEAAVRVILTPEDARAQEMVKKQLEALYAEMKAGVTTIEVLESRPEGEWVLVVCRVVTKRDGKTLERVSDQYFRRVDLDWKMIPETVRTDSAGKQFIDSDFKLLTQWYNANKSNLERKYLGQ